MTPGGASLGGAAGQKRKSRKADALNELSAKIMEELDGNDGSASLAPAPVRGALRDIERHAYDLFDSAYETKRSDSRPAEAPASPTSRSEGFTASLLEDGNSSMGTMFGAGRTPSSRAMQSMGRPSASLQRSMGRSSGSIPRPQRSFGTSQRVTMVTNSQTDNQLGPGWYDTHEIGTLVWERDHDVSHPGQKQLSQHRSPALTTFGKPKLMGVAAGPPLRRSPGPGHYSLPDLWDPNWQQFPRKGKSFDRKTVEPGESRFGGLARSLVKDSKSSMDFLG
uniref:Uncharacterized protein n=1 Tax=Alexandrium monilatum TaxID=311494 RepID=A0A7S4UP63_9DINO